MEKKYLGPYVGPQACLTAGMGPLCLLLSVATNELWAVGESLEVLGVNFFLKRMD